MATALLYKGISGGISGRVYYGDPAILEQVGDPKGSTVRSKEVYLAIPAYQTLLEENPDKGSARYLQLMVLATNEFKAAISAVSEDKGIHVVAEEGKVSGYHVTDITLEVIKTLKK